MMEIDVTKPQIIVSQLGERLVVLPEADYLALVERFEDASDLEAARAFDDRLAAGTEELVPSAVVDRILDGENTVRVWREYRGETVASLAAAAGISAAYLSQIEAGSRKGGLTTLRRIAKALSLDLDDIA